jgi:ferredoxin-NADP reductase
VTEHPATAWRTGTVVSDTPLTPSSKSIVFEVDGWPGNDAGQHLDVRLTAPDGYTATRSYSIASEGGGTRVELAVDRLPDGEVSPFLVDDLTVGDALELHGPLGGWFVWRPDAAGADPAPVQLIGGGSGVVPLMAMMRAHASSGDRSEFNLLYSVRRPSDVFYAGELAELAAASESLEIHLVYTREVPERWPTPAARITRKVLAETTIGAARSPSIYLCGSTGFVEQIAGWLIELGHDPARIRTERFGGT